MPDRSVLQKKNTTGKAHPGVRNSSQAASNLDPNAIRQLGQATGPLPAQDMLHLQRSVGNQALASRLKPVGSEVLQLLPYRMYFALVRRMTGL